MSHSHGFAESAIAALHREAMELVAATSSISTKKARRRRDRLESLAWQLAIGAGLGVVPGELALEVLGELHRTRRYRPDVWHVRPAPSLRYLPDRLHVEVARYFPHAETYELFARFVSLEVEVGSDEEVANLVASVKRSRFRDTPRLLLRLVGAHRFHKSEIVEALREDQVVTDVRVAACQEAILRTVALDSDVRDYLNSVRDYDVYDHVRYRFSELAHTIDLLVGLVEGPPTAYTAPISATD